MPKFIVGARLHDYGKGSPDELFGRVAADGFAAVQLAYKKCVPSVRSYADVTDALVAETVAAEKAHSIQVAVLGTYVELAINDESRLKNAADFKSQLAVCKALGAGCIGTETTSMEKQPAGTTREEAQELLCRSLADILAAAEALGVTVAVEPVTYHSMNSAAATRHILDTMRSPNLKVIFDMSNLVDAGNVGAQDRIWNDVGELLGDSIRLDNIREILKDIFDMERLITRIVYGSVTPREMRSLQSTAQKLPQLKQTLGEGKSAYLTRILNNIDLLEDICALIDSAIDEDPPALLKDGGVIRPGYDAELDSLREIVHNTKGVLASIEAKERERTGIKNLKIGFNNVFGYYLEVTKSFLSQVPPEYIRKQTLTGSERYITQELKELEQQILGARDKILVLENQLFDRVRAQVAEQIHRVQSTANAIAWLDLYASFAAVALQQNYCRPDVDLSGKIHIQDGRHPVVEKMLTDTLFVANDTLLDKAENQIAIITGPNMAGKSTYMRQVALIVLMAQVGSYVPARSAQIGVVDGIYTRVGASDDLASGQSTFMVEMSEVAQILQSATENSLLILDEIGRGTSTFDGMSIARAVIEHIANRRKLGAKTLFATHYHELTELEQSFFNIKNYNIAVKKNGDEIYFLRRIVRGGTDDSYGIDVSRLAGIPEEIIQRAQQILKQLESGALPSPKHKPKAQPEPMVLVQKDDSELVRRLKEIDIEKITPVQALVLLSELKARL